jgi:CBS domain-containing protein
LITALNIINPDIPALSPSEDPNNALSLMDQYRVAHLPVVEKGKFLGMASETAMLSAGDVVSDPDMHYTNLIDGSVEPDEHILEVLKSASELHLTAIPVVDKTGNFLGCVTLEDLVEKLSQMQGADRPGGIIVLEMAEHDYSLQQIARIVEENNAKILSTSVSPGDAGQIEVNLKISNPDVNAILQSFSRFNYNIKGSYQEPEYTEDMRKRYEELMRYLNI